MENNIIGRVEEKEILARLLVSRKPEFLALYGRRRIGKTFLVSEYFEGRGLYFEIVGSKDTPKETQIARFTKELSHKFYRGRQLEDPPDWDTALDQLVVAVDEHRKRAPDEKIILFFDELPWLDSLNSGFLSALDYLWNKHISKQKYKNVLVIVCGSASSWVISKVIDSRGGLHNRVTETIKLLPFTLAESNAFLESRGIRLERRQVTELYFALGGVAAYLNLVKEGMSAAQIINELCLTSGRYLTEEFGRLFSSLFDNYQRHVKIVRALATVRKGLNRADVLKKAGLSNGGESTTVLNELEQSGFISATPFFGKKVRDRIYRLNDEYSLFYIKWIEPAVTQTTSGIHQDYWLRMSQTPSWSSWAGYSFENLCLKNINKIKDGLGISGVFTRESTWVYKPSHGSKEKGAQIDLLISRADKTINLCEIKFSRGEFVVTKEIKENLLRKKWLFESTLKTKQLLLITLVTTYGLKQNIHSTGTVNNYLTFECLF
jgi:hypothetical protein